MVRNGKNDTDTRQGKVIKKVKMPYGLRTTEFRLFPWSFLIDRIICR